MFKIRYIMLIDYTQERKNTDKNWLNTDKQPITSNALMRLKCNNNLHKFIIVIF